MHQITAIPGRLDAINAYKSQGGRVAAVFPIHYPRALLRAFDILPVEVWGPPGIDSAPGTVHIQPYICSIAMSGLAYLQSGRLEVADLIVVPHTCDSLQGLGSILLDFIRPPQPVLPVYLPRGRRESDVVFYVNELGALYDRLASITGLSPSDEALLSSILREEAADTLLAELHQRRKSLPLTDYEFYRTIRSREFLPAETFMALTEATLGQSTDTERTGLPIILSGIVPEPMSMLKSISEMGAIIVADDLANCGRRLYPAGVSQEPFRRMAERLIHAPPDPTRGSSIEARGDYLLSLVAQSEARGVIFYDVKFCEPELFDLPDLRKRLRQAGVPSVSVEVSVNDPLPDQVITRIGAFLEML